MICKGIQKYTGTHCEKIQQMVNNKIKKEMEKTHLPKAIKDHELLLKRRQYSVALEKYTQAKENLKKTETKLHITQGYNYDTDKNKYYLVNECYIPQKVLNKLQKANDFSSLMKHKEAKKICDKIIEDYELL